MIHAAYVNDRSEWSPIGFEVDDEQQSWSSALMHLLNLKLVRGPLLLTVKRPRALLIAL